jgi:uncharacterized protein YndB with AHSA1/START domain
MNDTSPKADTRNIVVDRLFPHPPEMIWKALTSSEHMSRWLMVPTGFEPVEGKHFTFQTTPAGAWDGVIHCQVLEVIPNKRFAYAWNSGHESNVEYGSRLDTVVTFTLSRVAEGTRVRLVHSGFVLPRNEAALKNMGEGWKEFVWNLDTTAAEQN